VILILGAETHARSVLKAVSWRTLGTLDTFAISWLLTGRAEIAGSIAGIEIITKIAWYYLHERIWRREFGRHGRRRWACGLTCRPQKSRRRIRWPAGMRHP
jgi:uncharacterized membrane protein